MHRDKEYLYLALSAGAKGYLLNEHAPKELYSAIAQVRQCKHTSLLIFPTRLSMTWFRYEREYKSHF